MSTSQLVWHWNRLRSMSQPDTAKKYILFCLDSWISENPYLKGINWTSSLELGLRIISWALCFPLIENSIASDRGRLRQFSQYVRWHLEAISRNLSLHSSANNHLIGEAAGLYVGSICFPWWRQCRSEEHTSELQSRENLV